MIISFVPPQVKDILLYSVIAKNSVITPRLEVATEVSLGVHKKSVATCHNHEVVTSLLSTTSVNYHFRNLPQVKLPKNKQKTNSIRLLN